MKMPKPTDDDRNYFRSLIPDDPEVEIKPMFGNLAAFANGQMFASLLGASVGLRLDEPAYGELSAVAGAGGFGPGEKPMNGYVSLPAAWRDDPGQASSWVETALAQARTRPPKKARKK
jgi:TfoX/Sxy family transcriptional regulator of competence genes